MKNNNLHNTDKLGFVNEEFATKVPYQPLRTPIRHTIGKLGNGILRPNYTKLGNSTDFRNTPFQSDPERIVLYDRKSVEEFRQTITNSMQNRIDKAKLANETKQKSKVEIEDNKSSIGIGHIAMWTIAGSLLISMIYGIFFYKPKVKPKLKPKSIKV